MAAARRLTVKGIEAAKARSKLYRLPDGDGLYLSVYPTGAKRFYWRYKLDGKDKWLLLEENGRNAFPAISLEAARRLAADARAQRQSGTDPATEKRAQKLEAQVQQAERVNASSEVLARPTVQILFERWMQQELSKRKDRGVETERGFRKDVLPKIGAMRAESITRAHLMHILDEVLARGAPRMAKRFLSELRQMFRFALDREIIPSDPTAHIKKDRIGGKAVMRDRHLSEEEIRLLATSLPAAKLLKATETALWIMLATCCRVGELSRARWEDLDLERGTWLIPEAHAKNGRQFMIYLSDFAVQRFRELEALKQHAIWILPSRDGEGHLDEKSISKQVHDRQRSAPLSKRSSATATLLLPGGAWTPHDLRRTGATIMGNLGVAPYVIERCLNHVEQNRMVRTYQHQKLVEEQAQAWRLLGERLALLATSKVNIVPLPVRAA